MTEPRGVPNRFVTLLTILAALWVGFTATNRPSLALPVEVHLDGLSETERLDSRVFGLTETGWNALPAKSDGTWAVKEYWVESFVVGVPVEALDHLQRVRVVIGSRELVVLPEVVRASQGTDNPRWPIHDPTHVWCELPETVRAEPSILPREFPLANWPGDAVAFRHAAFAASPLLLFVLVLPPILGRILGANLWRTLLEPPANPGAPWSRTWDALGPVVLLSAIVALEMREPCFFTQDDALVAEVPGIVFGMRGFWAGEWIEYEPNLFLGGPFASTGATELTYPPAHVAYAIARFALGNEYLFAEVSAVLHLVAGYVVTRLLTRRVGLSAIPAVLVTLSFVLSGSILVMGRCWSQFIPTVVWLPAIVLLIHTLLMRPVGWRWVVGTAVVVACYFQAGFAPNAAFACGFACLAVAVGILTGQVPAHRAWALAGALLIAAGLSAPMLVAQSELMANVKRPGVEAGDLAGLLPAMVLPYPFVEAPHPMGWNEHDLRTGHLGYFGTLFPVLVLLEWLAILVLRPVRPFHRPDRVWLALATIAFVLTLGEYGVLWPVGTKLPVIGSMFRYPFRLLPALVLFTCLAGGFVLDRLLAPLAPRWRSAVGVVALLVLGWHVLNAATGFYRYGFRPYPEFPPQLEPVLASKSARVLIDAPFRDAHPEYAALLPHNLPVQHGLLTVEGYSPIHESKFYLDVRKKIAADPLTGYRAWGVRWVIKPGPGYPEREKLEPMEFTRDLAKLRPHLIPHVTAGPVRLSELPGSAPLAFRSGEPHHELPLTWTSRGATVDVRGVPAGETVTVNVLWLPRLRAVADNRELPIVTDDWGRVSVVLDTPADTLEIRYEPNWRRGFLLGGMLILIGWPVSRWANH